MTQQTSITELIEPKKGSKQIDYSWRPEGAGASQASNPVLADSANFLRDPAITSSEFLSLLPAICLFCLGDEQQT
ncbi:MAG: hypothetical protein WEB51_09210 [Mycobacterium sp.]